MPTQNAISGFALSVFLLPTLAEAQFSLTVTQVGLGPKPDGAPYVAMCGKDACRVVLPMDLDGDTCVLNVRVGTPMTRRGGEIIFAAGPCRSRRQFTIAANADTATYTLDRFDAASQTFILPVLPTTMVAGNPLMDDGVVRPGVAVRLDIVAARASGDPRLNK